MVVTRQYINKFNENYINDMSEDFFKQAIGEIPIINYAGIEISDSILQFYYSFVIKKPMLFLLILNL